METIPGRSSDGGPDTKPECPKCGLPMERDHECPDWDDWLAFAAENVHNARRQENDDLNRQWYQRLEYITNAKADLERAEAICEGELKRSISLRRAGEIARAK